MNSFRTIAAAAALAAGFSCTGIADAANFSGTWSITAIIGQPPLLIAAPVCTLTQLGNRIGGTCKGPNASGSSIGTVSGNSITLQWHDVNRAGKTAIATYSGSLGADGEIRGKAGDSGFPGVPGTFTAQRVK